MTVERDWRIAREALEQIHAHAEAEYADECCGLLLESDAGEQKVFRIANIQERMHAEDPERYPRTARTAYTGDPRDLQPALAAAAAPGNRLAAFYHSHPDHDAYFSEEDLAQATPFGEPSYPEAVQVVVSVYRGKVRDTRAFAWSESRQAYLPLSLVVG